MLESSFGLLFFLKASKSKKKERFVYLRITVDGESTEFSTKRIWYPQRWLQKSGKAFGTKEDARELNSYLETVSQKIYQAKKMLMSDDLEITAQAIKDLVTGKKSKRTIRPLFDIYIKQMEELVNVEYSPRTIQRYRTARSHLLQFIKYKFFKPKHDDKDVDFELSKINFEFINDFSFWIKSQKKCNHNSTVKYLGILKKIITLELKKGYIKIDPFAFICLTTSAVKVEPLNDQELKSIINKKICIPRLALVRDLFIFSCYTGLAYIDIFNLRTENIVLGIDKNKWFFIDREKTGTPTRVPLLPIPLIILDKYKDEPRVKDQGFALPVLSNQKMNGYLKEIADICNIKRNLTYHIARHTFATTVTLNNGVPLETVSKLLGHKSIKQTQHYAKLLDLKVSMDMEILKQVLAVQTIEEEKLNFEKSFIA